MSLPTYPFARERYWANTSGYERQATVAATRAVSVHDAPGDACNVLVEEWRDCELQDGSRSLHAVAVLLSDPQRRQALVETLALQGSGTRAVFIDTTALEQAEDDGRPSAWRAEVCAERFAELFASALDSHPDIEAVWYLWPLEDMAVIDDSTVILRLLQGMVRGGMGKGTLLLAAEHSSPLQRCYIESWIGYANSIRRTQPDLLVAVIHAASDSRNERQARNTEGDSARIATWTCRLLNEQQAVDVESVHYSGSRRQTLGTYPSMARRSSTHSAFRHGGTYLVTGGLGGIGFALAGHLARRYQARLVLTGRSAIDDEKRGRLNALRALGGSALYISADVSCPVQMESALAAAEREFGVLHGAIHAAGSKAGVNFLDADAAAFEAVLSAKVAGTRVLSGLLENRDIDFLCYFSSIAASLGDFGSCDYAVANRFQLAFAKYAGRNALAICWPLWSNGGMSVGDDAGTRMYLQLTGQRALSASEGIELCEGLLAERADSGITHALVTVPRTPGSAPTDVEGVNASCAARQADVHVDVRTGAALGERVTSDVARLASQLLKLPVERLHTDDSFADLGFDSIGLVTFAKRLSEYFYLDLLPSIFFSHSSVSALSDALVSRHRPAVEDAYRRHSSPGTDAPSGPVAVSPPEDGFSSVTSKVDRRAEPVRSAKHEPIAIVGMSGRFPGAGNITEFWNLLVAGTNAVDEIPADRFDWRRHYHAGGPLPAGAISAKWLGALSGIDEFDPDFFEISRPEAEMMDPRQRLLLQEAYSALEDAGYAGLGPDKRRVGVFVGVEQGDYQQLSRNSEHFSGNHDGILAARLSYFLNLSGPAMAINTACSSGLVALHQACMSLREGGCDSAIAAAANLLLTPNNYVAMSHAGMLSVDGECRAFGRRANGIVPGEAVVAVVLKTLSSALANDDRIYALIEGSGINGDGRTNGLTAPNGAAQAQLIEEVYQRAGVTADDIGYIVAHGTGTRLGDPVEVDALNQVFAKSGKPGQFCALTSAKTNIGHTFAASGLVSLINAVLALRHGVIPASLNCEQLSDYFDWSGSPLYVNRQTTIWPDVAGRRRFAGVSAFGMSGTNAHVVLREFAHDVAATPLAHASPNFLLVLSAKTSLALQQRAADLLNQLQQQRGDWTPDNMAALSYTLLLRRQHFAVRLAFVAVDVSQAIAALSAISAGKPLPWLHSGKIPKGVLQRDEKSGHIGRLIEMLSSQTGDVRAHRTTLEELARLYCQGHDLNTSALFGTGLKVLLSLPTYPFARERYWVESEEGFRQ
ncbi:SDR family NAD(P)-dependent oxidoreductase, partial [Tahibacter sp.]|uniref:SDR family NAD(P)-dependent oxidoreductase n=1 Tax=Tahibacter sp. TaxID=2056211 RepID=UPI0028C4C124